MIGRESHVYISARHKNLRRHKALAQLSTFNRSEDVPRNGCEAFTMTLHSIQYSRHCLECRAVVAADDDCSVRQTAKL